MPSPFVFWGCHEIRESVGIQAETERELVSQLQVVPDESIFYHSVRCLLRHQVGRGRYPDDFARWAADEMGDPELAERLALFSPYDMSGAAAFREHLISTIEDHMSAKPPSRMVARTPFRFLRGHLVAVPLGLTADDLDTLRAGIEAVDESSIYYHAVEAPGGQPGRRSDFSAWIELALGNRWLADQLDAIDPFVAGLGRTRALLAAALASGPGASR